MVTKKKTVASAGADEARLRAASTRGAKKQAAKKQVAKKQVAKEQVAKKQVSATPTAMPKKGRDPKGGLTAEGRAFFAKKAGSHLRPGVQGPADTPEKMVRKGSFLRRHFTHPRGPMRDANGEPTRLALSAHAWGEPVPKTMADARRLAALGHRLLEEYHHVQDGRTGPKRKAAAKKGAGKKAASKKAAGKRAVPAKRAAKASAKKATSKRTAKTSAGKKSAVKKTASKRGSGSGSGSAAKASKA